MNAKTVTRHAAYCAMVGGATEAFSQRRRHPGWEPKSPYPLRGAA